MSLTVWADEKLSVLKVGSEVYSNVTVTTVTPTDIFFTSDRGMANAKLKNLDPVLQNHFTHAAAKTDVEEEKQKIADPLPIVIDRTNAKSMMDGAIGRVKAIVNQTVRQVARTPNMVVSEYGPFWFHPGASKPDFNTVDIRTTQDLQYGRHQYVTSDLNPGVVFIGPELEFNPATKIFYTDRTVPKQKLTEAAMLEINRLYRIIGRCEQELKEAPIPESPLTAALRLLNAHKSVVFSLVALLFFALLFLRQRKAAI